MENAGLKHQKSDSGPKYDLRKLEPHQSFIWEDMDTSDSDDEWIASGKPKNKKRKSKYGSSNEGFNASGTNDSGGFKLDGARDGIITVLKKSESSVCCSCSKTSSYKTSKCQCRFTGGVCGLSCGCMPIKCSNRQAGLAEIDGTSESGAAEGTGHGGTDETEKNQLLVSQGAKLLQNALVERLSETTDDGGPRRKALAEIGQINLTATKARGMVGRKTESLVPRRTT